MRCYGEIHKAVEVKTDASKKDPPPWRRESQRTVPSSHWMSLRLLLCEDETRSCWSSCDMMRKAMDTAEKSNQGLDFIEPEPDLGSLTSVLLLLWEKLTLNDEAKIIVLTQDMLMCNFPGASMAKYHKRCSLNNVNILCHILKARNLKWRCLKDWLLLRTVRKGSTPALSWVSDSYFTASFYVCLCV